MAKPFLNSVLKLFGWTDESPTNLTKREIISQGAETMGGLSHGAFKESLNLSISPLQAMAETSQMAQSDLVQPIVEVYVEECCQPDIERGKSLWYECADSSIEDELNDMLEKIQNEDKIQVIARSLTCGGNQFVRVLTNDKGVVGFEPEDRVKRVYDPLSKRLYGFTWEGQEPEYPPYSNEPNVFAPWEFIHFRRLANKSQYGVGLLDFLYPVWRKLDLSNDQMVMYRLHTMPNRWAIVVDAGDDPVTAAETVNMFKQTIRAQVNTNGTVDFTKKYSPPSMDSIIFIPKASGEETTISTMTGTTDVPDVHDIEHLTKQLYGGARVPKAYLGFGDDGSGLAQASLVSQDLRFARMIRVLRRPVISGYLTLAHIHLALTGRDPSKYKVKVKMSKISSLEEEVNVAALEKQSNLAGNIARLCLDLGVPQREVIDLVFTEYLKLPRKFVELAKLGMSLAGALGTGAQDQQGGPGGMGGGMGMGGMPPMDDDLDLGGGMGDLEGGSDLGGNDDLANDLAKAEARINKLKPLMETISKRMKVDKVLTESIKPKVDLILEDIHQWRKEIRSHQMTGAVSLVEHWEDHPTPVDTDVVPPPGKKSALVESTSYKQSLPSTLALISESTSAEVPDAVNMVRKARKK